jgi:hypothetical protein
MYIKSQTNTEEAVEMVLPPPPPPPPIIIIIYLHSNLTAQRPITKWA